MAGGEDYSLEEDPIGVLARRLELRRGLVNQALESVGYVQVKQGSVSGF